MDFEVFKNSVQLTLTKNYLKYEGRASRQEFWCFAAFCCIISGVLAGVGYATGIGAFLVVQNIFSLATALPYLFVMIRRFHDIGKSGWWVLIGLVPLLGLLAMIYFMVQKSQVGPNKYGA